MKKISVLSLLCGLLLTPFSYAHFHYEVNSQATLVANAKNQLSAVKFSWIYSPEVSDMMLKSGQSMEQLSNSVMSDLLKLDYFTRLEFNGKKIPTSNAIEQKLMSFKQNDMNLLKLNFTLPLKSPMYIQGKNSIGLIHQDPNASATIYFRHADNLLLGNFAADCQGSVIAKKTFGEGETPEVVTINCKAK